MDTANDVFLGKTSVKISPIGLGAMEWGDIPLPDNPTDAISENITRGFQSSLNRGINFFDTAEMYGNGRSEIYVGRCAKPVRDSIVVATKFMPYPWRLSRGELIRALKRSLGRLGFTHVDLYQMHWPTPPVPITVWMESMAEAFSEGLIKAVGVSNYSPTQTEMAFEALAKPGIPLASNQVRYSLLHRRPETSGLAELCKKLGVTLIAYSPLEKGILTGKYSPEYLPTGWRAWRYNKAYLIKVYPLINALREIGRVHSGKTPGQVALNWLMANAAVPIPGARTFAQADENAGAMGWQLVDKEISDLDRLSNEL